MKLTLEELLNEFVRSAQEILGGDLTGIYLHGSAVMGCFRPEKSDIDLLVAVRDTVPDPVKRAFMDMTVRLNEKGPEKGIEMSIVKREVLKPFVYPTPFELHFSVMHLSWYRTDPEGYIEKMKGTDPDLAAHCMIITKRGKCLCGLPVSEVFGEVPEDAYLDSIRSDIEGAREEITEDTMYLTLNLARVLAFIREGTVLSKKEGGEWAFQNLPAEFRPLLETALREYTEAADVSYDPVLCRKYADYMLEKIGG